MTRRSFSDPLTDRMDKRWSSCTAQRAPNQCEVTRLILERNAHS